VTPQKFESTSLFHSKLPHCLKNQQTSNNYVFRNLTHIFRDTQWHCEAQSALPLTTCWTVRGSNSVVGEVFIMRPDRPWHPTRLLYNRHRVSFPGIKRPGRGINHLPTSNADVKETVELYPYSPSGPPYLVLGWILKMNAWSWFRCQTVRSSFQKVSNNVLVLQASPYACQSTVRCSGCVCSQG